MNETPVSCLLLDIEGTTTSVDFVYKTLFPYARRNLRGFLKHHFGEPNLATDLQQLKQEHEADAIGASDCPPWRSVSRESEMASAAVYVDWLMDRDRKSSGLKSLQGKIWAEGYRGGKLRSHLYPDVLPAFERWKRASKDICIFSSGSILAQKLLFAHTCSGDLSSFIRAYFDTGTGTKSDPESYRRIGRDLSVSLSSIYFLSDTISEVDAARTAGMTTAVCARGEATARDPQGHAVIRSFDEVLP